MALDDWRGTGWYLTPTGSRDLFAKIGSIGGFSSKARIAWRGMSSSDYELVSSLQRNHPGATEQLLRNLELTTLQAAREWGLGFGQHGWSSDFQLLADLQHYGTSTRLLDVTSNPMTALWFACQPPSDRTVSEDGLLLAVNTANWRRYGRGMPASSYSAVENPLTWELDEALREADPFVVESLIPNDRLRAQEGFFLAGRVPGEYEQSGPFKSFVMDFEPTTTERLAHRLTHSRPLGQSSEEQLPFVAIRIPARFKRRVLQRLDNSYNRNASVLFPDFFGFREFSPGADSRKFMGDTSEKGSDDPYRLT